MKKGIKFLVVVAVTMVVGTVPVFAQEVTDPNSVIKKEVLEAELTKYEQEFRNYENYRANNYVKYLDGVIYNLEETVRIKQEIVNNYKWLSQYNEYYSTLIPSAEKDLEQARAWVAYYKLYKENTEVEFSVRYPR